MMDKYFSKFLKAVGIIFFVTIGFFSVTEAREVTVTGVGTDRESALKDARRVAVEEVAGTFIDSRTLTNKSMVELDEEE